MGRVLWTNEISTSLKSASFTSPYWQASLWKDQASLASYLPFYSYLTHSFKCRFWRLLCVTEAFDTPRCWAVTSSYYQLGGDPSSANPCWLPELFAPSLHNLSSIAHVHSVWPRSPFLDRRHFISFPSTNTARGPSPKPTREESRWIKWTLRSLTGCNQEERQLTHTGNNKFGIHLF